MKKIALAALILFAFQLTGSAQNPPAAGAAAPAAQGPNPVIVDYLRKIPYEGWTLNVMLVNDRTADLLFQSPQKQAMKARSHSQTILYVQGTPVKDVDFSPTFSIVQGTETIEGKTTGFKPSASGKAVAGQRIDLIVEFPKKVDISKPFTVKNGTAGEAPFVLTEEAVKSLAPAPAPAP